MSLSILCTGDIHLGRHPAQIADQPDPQALSPTGAWRNFVQTALNRRVDIVALTGDIVDESNKFFEAYSVLHDGVGGREWERVESTGVFSLDGGWHFVRERSEGA
jgi:exonuclease SbcD